MSDLLSARGVDRSNDAIGMRVVFLGTAQFAVPTLRALVEAGLRPVAVYTRPDMPAGRGRSLRLSPVKRAALDFGLPVHEPTRLQRPGVLDELRRLEPTVLVLAAYGLLLPRAFLDIAPRGGLNVHPSLLPRHRGPSPVVATLLEGDAEAGVSIFLMDQGMDSGPVIATRRLPLTGDETGGGLTDILADVGARLLVEALGPWVSGSVLPQPQDETLATYSRLLSRVDGELDFHLPATGVHRTVRALNPWPAGSTRLNGDRLVLLRTAVVADASLTGTPGEVIQVIEDGGPTWIGVVTGEGVLRVDELQIAGKRSMAADTFSRGRRDFVGSVLPS
ncbi:MAG: methionyl-tRNA formyltransferase [Chloroflexi bacterium]|nr:methionyl-tRNA formyltransferase [Chloroflexota bacterium]